MLYILIDNFILIFWRNYQKTDVIYSEYEAAVKKLQPHLIKLEVILR